MIGPIIPWGLFYDLHFGFPLYGHLCSVFFLQAYINVNVGCTKDMTGPKDTCHEDLFWHTRRADIGLISHYRILYQKTHCSGLDYIYDPSRNFLARQEGYTHIYYRRCARNTFPRPWLVALARLFSEGSRVDGRRSRELDC